MIASLTGKLISKSLSNVIISVGGVGFKAAIPVSTFDALPEIGTEVTLLTYLHVKENALELIGFTTDAERDLFELLISVSGIGVKLALTILSGIKIDNLLESIISEDKAVLSSIPGVGAKTAGRVILDLKEKIGKVSSLTALEQAAPLPGLEEAILALEALGYSRYEAKRAINFAVKQVGSEGSSEELLKEALKVTA